MRKTETKICETCRLVPVRSGNHCSGCRVRKCRGAVIAGEQCEACGERHPRMLRWQRFDGGVERVLCANHAALVGRRALTWSAFLAELASLETLSESA